MYTLDKLFNRDLYADDCQKDKKDIKHERANRAEVLGFENILEHCFSPFRVFLAQGRMPAIEEVELDGAPIALSTR